MRKFRLGINNLYSVIIFLAIQLIAGKLCAGQQDICANSLSIPTGYAEIKERYKGSSDITVIHIQDAHCIYEAQKNIAKILEWFNRSCGVTLIAVEGADDVLTTDEFASFPHKQTRVNVSDYMMRSGRISGAEYFDIVSDSGVLLTGLEERSLYTENLSQYKRLLSQRARIDQTFARLERIQDSIEKQFYTPEMQTLIGLAQDYHAGRIQLTGYIQNLLSFCSRHDISLENYPNLQSIDTIYSIEKDLDFDLIQRQRRALIDELTEKMDADALRSLLRAHMDFKLMHRSHEDFHSYLNSLMQEYGISPNDYKNLKAYFSYLETYNSLDWTAVNQESSTITEQLLAALSADDTQRIVYSCRESLKLLHEMFMLYLPVYRYEEYLSRKESLQPAQIVTQLQVLASRSGIKTQLGEDQSFLVKTLPLVEQFYTVAKQRDKALLENLIAQMKQHTAKTAVFIAGGFHTKGITAQLKEKDISYVVVAPKVSRVPESNEYISMIMEQKNIYELYLGTSTLAIATWLERNPLTAQDRKNAIGYRMKSLMVGSYTYTVAQENQLQAQSDPSFLTGKIVDLLANWGKQNYGDIEVSDIRFLGPYLQVAMVVNGKEIVFLFTESEHGGRATLETPQAETMDILFNGAGELNLLESDRIDGMQFQVITPNGLKTLLAYGNKLNSRSTQELRESIREDMENRLAVLLIENQIEGPEQFQNLLKDNNIGLSKNELSDFFEKTGVYFMHDIFHPAFSASIANSTLVGIYLGVKAHDTGLYITNEELPAKVTGIFGRLGFDSMYIEQGIPVNVIKDFFRKLSSGDIAVTAGISDLYIGSDDHGAYYVSAVRQNDGRIFLKLEQANTSADDLTDRIDPAVLDMIITPATYPAQEENLLTITQSEPGITFVEVKDNKMVINLLKVDKSLAFQKTDIKLSIDLSKKLPGLEAFFTQIKTAAAENGIHLLGVVMNNPELTGGKAFFHDFEGFMQAYYSFIVGLEVNKRLSQRYGQQISVRVMSNNFTGKNDRLMFSNIAYTRDSIAEFDLITERIAPSKEGYRFNIGLGEFLQDRFENLKPYPVKFEPQAKLVIRHNSIPYTLGKGTEPGDIRLLLSGNQYSARLTDGEIEFINHGSRTYKRDKIEHRSGKLPQPASVVRRQPLYVDQWTKYHYTRDSQKLYDFLSQITPFFADKIFNYQTHLKSLFGDEIRILDLFGFQGSLLQQILRKSQDSVAVPVNVSPFVITNSVFDASVSKELLKKYDMDADRVINATAFYDPRNTIGENFRQLQAKNDSRGSISPHVVTLVGKTLEHGVTSYNDAINMVGEIYDLLPDQGLLFVGGTDFLVLQEQDFINIGFEVVEMGNHANFFDESVLPKQFYILRKPIAKSSFILPGTIQPQERIVTDQRIIEHGTLLQPVQDAFEFVLQLNKANLTLTSPHDNKTYSLQLLPKIKIQRPDGGVQLITDLSHESMEASVDGKVYYEIFLVTDDAKSLLPVMEGTMSIGLKEFTINRVMLESVNFQGLLKDLHDIDFTYTIARQLSQLLPDDSVLTIDSDLSHGMILALYQTLASPKNTDLFKQLQELSAKIANLRQKHTPVDDLLQKLYEGTAVLRRELQRAMADTETLSHMNDKIDALTNLAPVRPFIDAGFSKVQLSQYGKDNRIALTMQKSRQIPLVMTRGSLRHGFMQNSEASIPDNTSDKIREKLLEIQEILVAQHKVTDEYFRSLTFNVVQGAKTHLKLQAGVNTIVLNYDLFRDIDGNHDMLVMEIEKGIQRIQIQSFAAVESIAPIEPAIQELYLLLHHIQTFIDIRYTDASLQQGIRRQQDILRRMERDMDTEDRTLLQLFKYIYNNEIKSAWAIRYTAFKLITATGEFEGTNIYPEHIRSQLMETSDTAIFNEIDRIIQLMEYSFIKEVVTKSRTSKYSLNIRSHKEKSINELIQGNRLQVGYIKIQNFKDVFNTFGAGIDLGHSLGDIGIYVISRQLKEAFEKELQQYGITVHIGNAGSEFFISFSGAVDVDLAAIMQDILINPKSSFRKDIITETELALIDFVGKEKFAAIADQFRHGFTEDKIHFYAGLSEYIQVEKADEESDIESRSLRIAHQAALAIDRMYLQAFQVAKHQQLHFDTSYSEMREQAIQKKTVDLADQSELAGMLAPVVKGAGKQLKSGLMVFSPEYQSEIEENLNLGLLTEYQLFHRPIAPTYQHYTSIESLSDRLLLAIENRSDEGIISELKDRIVETVLQYKSPNLSQSEFINEGNENFKRIINFCISSTPDYDISLTFRLGGDEYGKLVWDPVSKVLHIYRFDGNNVGATTFEWGIDIGDKLIDESLRIISHTDDMTQLQKNIETFFNDMNDHGIELDMQELQDIRKKTPSALVFDESNYRLLKQNGTFLDFTKDNSTVIVRKEDGRFMMVKFPDIHVPYTIQKDSITFNYETLAPDPQFESAVSVTFLVGDSAIDFKISKDSETGDVVISSQDERAPKRVAVSSEQIQRGEQITIPIAGAEPIYFFISMGYRNNVSIEGNILALRENEFQRVKLAGNKLVEKDGKLAVLLVSRPVVSTGYLAIDTKKIDPKYLSRDISVIQGRADSASEVAKERTKLHQILYNGAVRNEYTFHESENKFTGSPREMTSFDRIDFSFWDTLVSRYIIEGSKEKLNRRIEYFTSNEDNLQADDIFILAQMYINNPNLIDDFQKTMLLYRLVASYHSFADFETRFMVTNTLRDILTSVDKDVWHTGIAVFLSMLPSRRDESHEELFQRTLNLIRSEDPNPKQLMLWYKSQPSNFHEWVKLLIDTGSVNIIESLHQMTYDELDEYSHEIDMFLPISQQYIESYNAGWIVESNVRNHPEHKIITDNLGYHDKESLKSAYDFARSMVFESLRHLMNWNDISTEERSTLLNLITGTRIIEDSIVKIFGRVVKLGDIQAIHIAQGEKSQTKNEYFVTVELIDGTRFESISLNILPNFMTIYPVSSRKYFTTQALKEYIARAGKISAVDPLLSTAPGDYYEISLPDNIFSRVVTGKKIDSATSAKLISEAGNNFRGKKVEEEKNDIAFKDIVAYMRIWDILGREMFFESPSPNNISKGTNISSLQYIQAGVSNEEIVTRLFTNYSEHVPANVIFDAIVAFFTTYDPLSTSAGYQFLSSSYEKMENMDVKDALFIYLNNYLGYLKTEIKSHTEIPLNLFLTSIRISRIISHMPSESSFFTDALAVLEEKVSFDKTVTLNYPTYRFIVETVTNRYHLPVQELIALENDVIAFFTLFGYNPEQELQELLLSLSSINQNYISDNSVRELIDRIESIEVAIGLKNPDEFSSVTWQGNTYGVHPYTSPISIPMSNPGSMPPVDAVYFFDEQVANHFSAQDRPFIVSFTGRAAAGKIEALNFIIKHSTVISENDVGIIKSDDIVNAQGKVDMGVLRNELDLNKDKKVIILYGRDILLNPEITSVITFDYNIFVESDEASRIKRFLQTGNTNLLNRMLIDNIVNRWGLLHADDQLPVQPNGIDTQRTQAGLIIDMSSSESTALRQTRVWEPETISMIVSDDLEVAENMKNYLNMMKNVFHGDTTRKHVAIYEPQNAVIVTALAMAGFRVTVISEKLNEINLSLSDQYRIKVAGGSISFADKFIAEKAEFQKPNMFDLIIINDVPKLLETQRTLYTQTTSQTSQALLNSLRYNGILMMTPDVYCDTLKAVSAQMNISISDITESDTGLTSSPQSPWGQPLSLLRKNIPASQLVDLKIPLDAPLIDAINQTEPVVQTHPPAIIAIDFDDIESYATQWDAYVLITALKKRQEYYRKEDIPVQFAFVSTQSSSQQIRAFLKITERADSSNFLFLGNEDLIDSAFVPESERAALFAKVPQRLSQLSRFFNPNIILIESDPERARHAISANSIVLDISSLIGAGQLVDEILQLQSFLETTLLSNKIDRRLIVSSASPTNPFREKVAEATSGQPRHLHELLDHDTVSFHDLRGLVIVPESELPKPQPLRRTISNLAPVDQSL
ncbi:MAG: hypothetical protein RBU23_12150 [Candidatus Auribacterota bacterium]|jgi:hypothetical protein|nr:hypothetical protein [Candidatus Auribacterota bacterium]